MSTHTVPVAAVNTAAATRRYRTWTPAADRYLIALIAEGRTHDHIGRRLGISTDAVRARAARVYADLGAANGPHAVAIALRTGLIPATDRPSQAWVVVGDGPDREIIPRAPAPNPGAHQQ